MHHSLDLMELNMLRAFQKAFHTDDPRIRAVRRRAYANLHTILASYNSAAGHPWRCARHVVCAGWRSPGVVVSVLRPPAARVLRSLRGPGSTRPR
jgi:hypothetical protein